MQHSVSRDRRSAKPTDDMDRRRTDPKRSQRSKERTIALRAARQRKVADRSVFDR